MQSDADDTARDTAGDVDGSTVRFAPGDPALDGNPTRRDSSRAANDATDESLGFFLPHDIATERPGDVIGMYTLVREIGRGGFGNVWLAEQFHPVKRQVALKIIKLGMDTRQVVARFEQERQALAMMEHPNIARVIDAGATATGRPFFVMDLVKGEPISRYCDHENLTIAQRLELFAEVANAVQHAHGKGIIHRDLKASNVLVGTVDGKPHATVIDFGIAKATSSKLTDKTLETAAEQVIGTLQYMSPEQAAGSLDIDTRTDVYSLGVMLYELLTGSTPFDKGTMRDVMLYEMQRVIREVDPPTPSARVEESRDTITHIAANRRIEPKRLKSMIRGDLDWIVMKALEKDRERRYETANGLAMDIRRFLAGEPVVAAPPSATYRIKKFVRRHKATVVSGSAVAAALIVGIVGFAWQAGVAADERDRAVTARQAEAEQRAIADTARRTAEKQKLIAEERKTEAEAQQKIAEASARAEAAERKRVVAMNHFFTDALRMADPHQGGSNDMLVTDALTNAAKKLEDGAFGNDPELEASVRSVIADIFYRNAKVREALPFAERALDLYEEYFPGDDRKIQGSLNLVATIEQDLGNYKTAEPLLLRSLAILRRIYPGDHDEVGMGINNLARIYSNLGRHAEAEPLFIEALEMKRRLTKSDNASVAMSLNNLANCLESLGRRKESAALYDESLAMYERLFDKHPELAMSLYNVGQIRIGQGRLAESEELLTRALAMYRSLFRGDHPDTARAVSGVANVKKIRGKTKEAEPLFEEAVAVTRRLFPGDHPLVARHVSSLARFRQESGRAADAEELYRKALDMQRRLAPTDHPIVADSLEDLASAQRDLEHYADAESTLTEAVERRRRLDPNGSDALASSMNQLAEVRRRAGKTAEAESLSRAALEMSRSIHREDHPMLAASLAYLARILLAADRAKEAVALFEESLAVSKRYFKGDHYDVAVGLLNLANAQQQVGQKTEARVAFDESIAMHRRRTPDGSMPLSYALADSGAARLENGEKKKAMEELTEALELAERFLPPNHRQIAKIRANLEKCRAD